MNPPISSHPTYFSFTQSLGKKYNLACVRVILECGYTGGYVCIQCNLVLQVCYIHQSNQQHKKKFPWQLLWSSLDKYPYLLPVEI